MAIEVGAVYTRAGAHFDETGFKRWETRFDQARAKARGKIEAKLGADVDASGFRKFARESESAEHRARSMRGAARDSGSAITDLGKRFRESGGNIGSMARHMSLLKWPALITGAGAAAQAISALAGGAVALGGALAPLSGALAAYPALGSAAAQATGTWRLATSGLGAAVGGLNEKLDKSSKAYKALSPEGQRFAQTLQRMKPQIRDLQKTAQAGLFPGLERGVRSAMHNLPVVQRLVGATARELGRLSERAGRQLGSADWGRDLATQGGRNVQIIGRLGTGAMHMANALRHVTIAAGPLVSWMTKLGLGWTRSAEGAAKAGRENGKLAEFFHRTRVTMGHVLSIGESLGKTLMRIGSIGSRMIGRDMLRDLDQGAKHLERWSRSSKGVSEIGKYFRDIKGPLYEAGRLARDVFKAFLDIGRGSGLESLLRQVRTQLLPVFRDVVKNTTAAFGPHLVNALTQIGKLFGNLAGSSGPLTIYVDLIAGLAKGLNALFDVMPGSKSAVVTLMGVGAVLKVIPFAGSISGFTRLSKTMRDFKKAAELGSVAREAGKSATIGQRMADGILRPLRPLGRSIAQTFRNLRSTLATSLKMAGSSAGSALSTAIVNPAKRIGGRIRSALAGVKNIARSALSAAGTVAGNALSTGVVKPARGIAGRVRRALGGLKNALTRIFFSAGSTAGEAAADSAAHSANKGLGGALKRNQKGMIGKFSTLGGLLGSAAGVAAGAAIAAAVSYAIEQSFGWLKAKIHEASRQKGAGGTAARFYEPILNTADWIRRHAGGINPILSGLRGPADAGRAQGGEIESASSGRRQVRRIDRPEIIATPAGLVQVGEEAPTFPETLVDTGRDVYVFSSNPRDQHRMRSLAGDLFGELGMPGFRKGGRMSIRDLNALADRYRIPAVRHHGLPFRGLPRGFHVTEDGAVWGGSHKGASRAAKREEGKKRRIESGWWLDEAEGGELYYDDSDSHGSKLRNLTRSLFKAARDAGIPGFKRGGKATRPRPVPAHKPAPHKPAARAVVAKKPARKPTRKPKAKPRPRTTPNVSSDFAEQLSTIPGSGGLELRLSNTGMALSSAERTPGIGDDIAALQARQGVLRARIKAIADREAYIRSFYPPGKVTIPGNVQSALAQMVDERAGLTGDLTSIDQQIAGLQQSGYSPGFEPEAPEAPELFDEASQGTLDTLEMNEALAALTPGSQDDIAAASALEDFWGATLGQAQARGIPRLVTQAAQGLLAARKSREELTAPSAGGATSDAEALAQTAMTNLATFDEARRSLFTGQGGNFVAGSLAGARYFGAAPSGSGGVLERAGATHVYLQQTYNERPQDPHHYTQALVTEMQAAL